MKNRKSGVLSHFLFLRFHCFLSHILRKSLWKSRGKIVGKVWKTVLFFRKASSKLRRIFLNRKFRRRLTKKRLAVSFGKKRKLKSKISEKLRKKILCKMSANALKSGKARAENGVSLKIRASTATSSNPIYIL